MVNPKIKKDANVPIKDTGTANIGISVASQLCRKINTMIKTRNSASMNVFITSSKDAWINSVLSITIRNSTSGGKRFFASSIAARTCFMDCMALASGVSCTANTGAFLPLILPIVDKSLAPISIRAISPRRSIPPSGCTLTIILANSSGVTSRPLTRAEYSNCCSATDGSLPIAPAGA